MLLIATSTVTLVCWGGEADWYEAEREVTSLLWASNVPIAHLVTRVTSRPPADSSAAVLKLCVEMRAGMNEQAVAAVRELKELCPNLPSPQISAIYYYACDQESDWDVAQALLEEFAGNVTDVALENRLLKHWEDSGRIVDQIDQWLAARPPGIDSFWIKERFRFAQSHGRGEALMKQLSDGVRLNPRDVSKASVLLDALLYARQGTNHIDLDWFEGVVKPERAVDALTLGEKLQGLENWRPALSCFRQAVSIPLTEAEIQELGNMRQVLMPREQLRAAFVVSAREGMAECLLHLGRADAAQQEMVKAADIRAQHGLGANTLLEGRVQAESGQHMMERRITEAEKHSENEPDYWHERAAYFRGRQESEQEEQALKKALALTIPRPPPEQASKGHADERALALSDYASFLAGHRRVKEAVALLRQEMVDAPAATASSERAARLLAFDFSQQVGAGDDVLWKWLENRPAWSFTEERLLWRMLESAAGVWTPVTSPSQGRRTPEKVPNEKLEQYFSRAEKVVGNGNASHAYTLGWIMNRMGFPKRSLPLLKAALEKTIDQELKQRATFALFESYLDTGAWKEAEALFPEASRQLTAREIPEWHSRLALLAARAGSKEDALRLWCRTANLAPTALRGLPELAGLGLRQDLVDFYDAMHKGMPESHAPVRALDLLDAMPKAGPDH